MLGLFRRRRSSVTGQFVSKAEAEANPSTTQTETARPVFRVSPKTEAYVEHHINVARDRLSVMEVANSGGISANFAGNVGRDLEALLELRHLIEVTKA
jgi:hypothetical protein